MMFMRVRCVYSGRVPSLRMQYAERDVSRRACGELSRGGDHSCSRRISDSLYEYECASITMRLCDRVVVCRHASSCVHVMVVSSSSSMEADPDGVLSFLLGFMLLLGR